jgi:hypothetical protein
MNRLQSVGLAAVLAAGLAVPALAAGDQSASIAFHGRHAGETIYSAFSGPVDTVRLSAESSSIRCDYIQATYSNRFSELLFSGVLRTDGPVSIPLAGYRRDIKMLTFSCHSEDSGGGSIKISTSNAS